MISTVFQTEGEEEENEISEKKRKSTFKGSGKVVKRAKKRSRA